MDQTLEVLQRIATLEERSRNALKLQEELQDRIESLLKLFETRDDERAKEISALKVKVAAISAASSGIIGTLASLLVQTFKGHP